MAYPRFLRARQHKHILDSGGNMSSLTSGSKVALGTPPRFDIVLPAAVGDVIEAGVSFYWNADNTSGGGWLDFATVVSSALVSFFSGTGTGIGGIPQTYGEGDASNYHGRGGLAHYTLTAADISSGKVTVRLVYDVASGSKNVNSDSTRPVLMWAKNLGPVSPH